MAVGEVDKENLSEDRILEKSLKSKKWASAKGKSEGSVPDGICPRR